MKNIFSLVCIATLLAGCTSYYPPRTSMYSDYGFTYDYNQSPVPSAIDVPVTDTTPAPTFLVQVPPPTVVYQTTQAPIQSSIDTNTVVGVPPTGEPNPYKGSYIIPPKVVVVPQQTIIHEAAGAAPGGTAAGAVTQQQPIAGYPGVTYISPGFLGGVINTNTNGPGTNTSINITNSNLNSITNSNQNVITNTNQNVVITNTNNVVITNQTGTPVTNTVNTPAGAQRTNLAAPAPFTPVPRPPTTATPPVGTQPGTALIRPRNTQSTTGSGTGQPAQTTTGGSFAPPPPGTTPLPGTAPRP